MQIGTMANAPAWATGTQQHLSASAAESSPGTRRAAFDTVSLPALARTVGASTGELESLVQHGGGRLTLPVGHPAAPWPVCR